MRLSVYNKLLVVQLLASDLLLTESFFLQPARRPKCSHMAPATRLFVKMDGGDRTQYIDDKKEDEINGELSPGFWEEVEQSQPSELQIMKELLGINIFTYILAGAIVFFLSMNAIYGAGWLGSSLGIPGTGTIMEQSTSLPATVDLSLPEFRINEKL